MSKVKTNELLKDVSNHIRTKMGFNVEEDGFSDYEGKYLVNSLNPNFRNSDGIRNRGEYMFIHHITFSVFKNSKKEQFIIWDKRVNQPFFKSDFCVYKGSFGRYEFNNKVDFYKHIETDYGMDEIVEWEINNRKELETNIN
jgi:hypothetical protein